MSFENRLAKKDGSTIQMEWNGQLVRERSIAVLVGTDVTARNEALAAVREREQEFQEIIDRMPTGIVSCDRSNMISSVNPAALAMFGYRSADLLGESIELLLCRAGASGQVGSSVVEGLLAASERQPVELNLMTSAGGGLAVEFDSRRCAVNAGEVHLLVFRDVSARFEIEQVKKAALPV